MKSNAKGLYKREFYFDFILSSDQSRYEQWTKKKFLLNPTSSSHSTKVLRTVRKCKTKYITWSKFFYSTLRHGNRPKVIHLEINSNITITKI